MNKSHARFLKLGLDTNPIIATRLLNSYIATAIPPSQQSLTYAHQLFEQVPLKDTTLWTSIISAYTRAGYSHKALQLFSQMLLLLQSQPLPNHYVYATVARACCGGGGGGYLQLGQTIHARVIKTGFLSNFVVVQTSFLDMYAKCGLMESARKMFVEMPQRNLISWNALIAGYLLNGMEVEGLELFYRMKCVEFEKPDEYTVATVLAACARRINDFFNLGMQLHAHLFKVGFEKECTSALCNMYFRGGEVLSAERVFLEHGKENALLKLIMIKGYVFNGRHIDALQFLARNTNFVKLVEADISVISSVLTACADLSLLRIGRQVHGLIVALLSSRQTCQSDDGDDVVFIESSLINMYCKCYSVVEARRVCDNLLSVQSVSHWNSIITGYIFNGLLEDARRIFEEMTERNVVSWTAVISGYVQCGLPDEALRLVAKFYNHEDGLQGNCFTLTTALEACSHMTELNSGKQIHAKLIRTMVTADCNNPFVETALVDMYSKSGSLNYAERMFDRIMDRNVVSWTSMITGYAIHGLGSRALKTFKQMLEMGIEPNEVTFVSVLNACSHCGLVDVGMQYFKLMRDKYGIVPRGDHYACVIDLLGRAGKFTEAWSLLEKFEDEVAGNEFYARSISGALLGSCRLHGNVEMGSRVAEKMLEKKHQVPDTYITLSNVYAIAGMWHESYKVRERWRSEGGVVREPGQSRIHTNLVTPILADEKPPVLTVDR